MVESVAIGYVLWALFAFITLKTLVLITQVILDVRSMINRKKDLKALIDALGGSSSRDTRDYWSSSGGTISH